MSNPENLSRTHVSNGPVNSASLTLDAHVTAYRFLVIEGATQSAHSALEFAVEPSQGISKVFVQFNDDSATPLTAGNGNDGFVYAQMPLTKLSRFMDVLRDYHAWDLRLVIAADQSTMQVIVLSGRVP